MLKAQSAQQKRGWQHLPTRITMDTNTIKQLLAKNTLDNLPKEMNVCWVISTSYTNRTASTYNDGPENDTT